MYNRNLFCLVYIALFFSNIYGLTKDEVLKNGRGQYYCKNDICVSTKNRIDLDTIIIPNKEGKEIKYITDTCSTVDVDLGLCFSKNCTADSQCLSSKCYEGHCAYDETNPPEECQYVRTVHNNPIFGDPKGYKTQCGLPYGYKCNSNDDCSSYNCETYNNGKKCGYPDDSGCHSACYIGRMVFFYVVFVIIFIIGIIACCVYICVKCGRELDKTEENEKTVNTV